MGHGAIPMSKYSNAQGSRGLRDRHCILILLLITAVLFRKALWESGVILSHPVFFDLTHSLYAWRLFGFGLLREGVVPLWNPYSFCGTPFVANWHSAIFYPPNAIFLFLPAHIGINWSIAFHFFLTGALTYLFVRHLLDNRLCALLAAISFVFSGPYIIQLFPGHVFNSLPWLPLSLLLAELALRRKQMVYYVLGGIVLALQVLAGHPQYMLYCFGALAIYLLFGAVCTCRDERSPAPLGRVCIGFVVLCAVGFSLSAVQLFPGLEYSRFSSRTVLKGPASVSELSFPPENLITLIAPGFWGDMQGARYWGRWLFWETCMYVGVAPLVLAVIGALFARKRHAYLFAGLALLSLVLAFGAYSPFFNLLYYHVPGFNLFRGQAKFIFLTTFSLAVLAGYGCEIVLERARAGGRGLTRAAVVTLIAAGVVILLCAVTAAQGGERSSLWQQVLRYRAGKGFEGTPPLGPAEGEMMHSAYRVTIHGVAVAGILLGAAGAILLAVARGGIPFPAVGIVLITLSIADLWCFGARYIMVSPLAACYWPRGVVEVIKSDRASYRICTPNIAIPGATQNMNNAIPAIDGYETVNIGYFKEYVDFSQGVLSQDRLTFSIERVTPMLEALNLKYVILPADQQFAMPDYRVRYGDGRENVYARERSSPRAYVAHTARIVGDRLELLRELGKGDFAERGLVLFGSDPGVRLSGPARGAPAAQTDIVVDRPGETVIAARLTAPGFLVLSDTWYPGWKAYVDGAERPVLRANYAFRAVYLEAGRHTIRFIYRPASFRYGAMMTLATALALIALALICGVRLHGRMGGVAALKISRVMFFSSDL